MQLVHGLISSSPSTVKFELSKPVKDRPPLREEVEAACETGEQLFPCCCIFLPVAVNSSQSI